MTSTVFLFAWLNGDKLWGIQVKWCLISDWLINNRSPHCLYKLVVSPRVMAEGIQKRPEGGTGNRQSYTARMLLMLFQMGEEKQGHRRWLLLAQQGTDNTGDFKSNLLWFISPMPLPINQDYLHARNCFFVFQVESLSLICHSATVYDWLDFAGSFLKGPRL